MRGDIGDNSDGEWRVAGIGMGVAQRQTRVGVLALTEFLTLMKLSTSITLPCRLLPTRLGCCGGCGGGCWGAAMGTG